MDLNPRQDARLKVAYAYQKRADEFMFLGRLDAAAYFQALANGTKLDVMLHLTFGIPLEDHRS